MNLGGTELFIITLIVLMSYAIPIWAVVDAITKPEAAYAAIGSSKNTQLLTLILTAIFCGIIGTVISIVYLISTRPKLAAAAGT